MWQERPITRTKETYRYSSYCMLAYLMQWAAHTLKRQSSVYLWYMCYRQALQTAQRNRLFLQKGTIVSTKEQTFCPLHRSGQHTFPNAGALSIVHALQKGTIDSTCFVCLETLCLQQAAASTFSFTRFFFTSFFLFRDSVPAVGRCQHFLFHQIFFYTTQFFFWRLCACSRPLLAQVRRWLWARRNRFSKLLSTVPFYCTCTRALTCENVWGYRQT